MKKFVIMLAAVAGVLLAPVSAKADSFAFVPHVLVMYSKPAYHPPQPVYQYKKVKYVKHKKHVEQCNPHHARKPVYYHPGRGHGYGRNGVRWYR